MNSSSHVSDVSGKDIVAAPQSPYLLSNELAGRLGSKDAAWWASLVVTGRSTETGIDDWLASDGEGHCWRIRLADWNTPAASRLQFEAALALTLGEDLAETPLFLAEVDRLALVYPAPTGRSLAEDLGRPMEIGWFLDCATTVAAALARLHGAGVIHGRLAPVRIRIEADGRARFTGFAWTAAADFGAAEDRRLADGDIPYAAPELIRPDASPADARSDLYALGVLLHELLTGSTPLLADDLPGWLHAHVAVEAPSVRLARPDVPEMVAAILRRLLAKDPRARYQTARALEADLSRVARSIAATGEAETFELARGEFAEPARHAAHLVGRGQQLTAIGDLYAGFLASSQRRIVLVTGEAGAGKSALVEAFLDDLRRGDAICCSGKGVELRQGTPFAPMADVLRTALARLTAGDERALEAARSRLAGVVGGARVIWELVPEASILPPPGPHLADVPAHLAQARAARIVAESLAALATAEAPLVLFLDDLQWFDQGSLNVLRQLCEEAPPHVFLVASYRTEAGGRGAVRDILSAARSSAAFATELKLGPLSERDTTALVASMLKSLPDEVRPIGFVVHRETGGNPFHIGQLLQRSLDQQVLEFDADRQEWVWNEHRRREPHEIVGLMRERIDALPPPQRSFLQRCASLGGRTTAVFAAALSGAGLEETVRTAHALVAAGLLRRSGSDFVIAHDRVLEAAYAAMAPAHRARDHLGNARLLAAAHPNPDPDRAFEIASQIERCDLGNLTADERPSFAAILLRAARACRSAGETRRALHFAELIRCILPNTAEGDRSTLVFEAEWLQCDCLLALGRVDEALDALAEVSRRADDAVAFADTCRLRAIAWTIKSSYALAIESTLEGLRALDIDLETHADPAALEMDYRACRERLDAVGIDALVALPEATDPRARSALALLSTLISSFFVEGELRFLHVLKMLELTLEHGSTPEAAYGLAWFGVLGAHYFGAYESGAAYSAAACKLATRDGYEAQRTAAFIALDQVGAWTLPMRTALGYAREGARIGQAAGDLGMACYARNHIASDLLVIGDPLDRVRAELVDSIAMTREVGYRDIELILAAQMGLVDALSSGDLASTVPDAELATTSVATRFWVKHYAGLQAFFIGSPKAAMADLEEAEAMAWAAPAHIDTANNCFFLALAEARLARPEAGEGGRMAKARARFAVWSRLNPETFAAKHLMLEAEAARLAGRAGEAMELYGQAAKAAARARFGHDEALAHELAAAFYRAADLVAPAEGCLAAAMRLYRHWGAHAKAAALGGDTASPSIHEPSHLLPERLQNELDLQVMTAASQALAEEIGLEQVVRSLMKSMVIHAGAQFGLLVLLRQGEPVIEAVARIRAKDVEIDFQPQAKPEDLMPASVLKTVLRTARPVTLADAVVEASQRGLSMGGRAIRSLACIPLVKRGELIGVLYLENALSADVFTPRRMAMLEVLAPQAAISLDAARLYGDLMDENLRRAQAEFELREARSDLARANQMTAMGSFAASIAHEINQPLASLVAQADAGLRWLNRKEPDLGEVANSLSNIREAGRRAADIIAALRSLVRQEAAPLAPVVIDDVLREVLKIAAADLAASGTELRLELGGDLRPIQANGTQLQQVFFNLITNAIQSMAGRDPSERRLRIGSRASGEAIEVAIEDAGCGMSEETMARIFRPFFTTKASGMGVGLAICRSIVELHGGSLEARSVEGTGSTFLVRIPFAED